MKTKTAYPLLTPDDILTLRGNPMAKRVEPLKNSFNPAIEEWIYYNVPDKTKECYQFKNGKLAGYKTEQVTCGK